MTQLEDITGGRWDSRRAPDPRLRLVDDHHGFLNSAARLLLFGHRGAGRVRWYRDPQTGAFLMVSCAEGGIRVQRTGHLSVRPLTARLPGPTPVTLRLESDPETNGSTERMLRIAGVVR